MATGSAEGAPPPRISTVRVGVITVSVSRCLCDTQIGARGGASAQDICRHSCHHHGVCAGEIGVIIVSVRVR